MEWAVPTRASGHAVDEARTFVQRQVVSFVERLVGEVDAVRVRLTAFRLPDARPSVLAQLNVTADGRLIRIQVVAAAVHDTAALLHSRLRDHLARLAQPALPRGWPDQHRQHHQPVAVPLPAAARKVVRRKRYLLVRCSPDDAALTMDLRDYDFHLFVDCDTGQDSIVYRVGPTGYRLARQSDLTPPRQPAVMPWTVSVDAVPHLKPGQAAGRLDTTDMPYRFFQDAASGRGSVLYRRYDGHYALIAASAVRKPR